MYVSTIYIYRVSQFHFYIQSYKQNDDFLMLVLYNESIQKVSGILFVIMNSWLLLLQKLNNIIKNL